MWIVVSSNRVQGYASPTRMVSAPDRAPHEPERGGRLAARGLGAVTITFFALRLGTGDPTASLLAQGLATPAQAQALRHELGLDQPLFTQYLGFLSGLARGDLGQSLYTGRPVLRVIAEQAPSTAELAGLGLLLAVVLGLVLGVVGAWHEEAGPGQGLPELAGEMMQLPVAFTGIVGSSSDRRSRRRSYHSVWAAREAPCASRAWSWAALQRAIAGSCSGPEREPDQTLHPGVRTLCPTSALAALARASPGAATSNLLGALEAAYLSGAVVTETVFSRPGLGRLLVSAILQGDFPIVQGLVVLAAIVYTASHFLADALAMLIDPRLRGPA
jgi:peptide/nickel transport system permease protein